MPIFSEWSSLFMPASLEDGGVVRSDATTFVGTCDHRVLRAGTPKGVYRCAKASKDAYEYASP